jgi:hypothetical protein
MKKNKPIIAVWFSCGAASAVAAALTLKEYGDTHQIFIVNNPVDEEDADNRRFLKDVEVWLNHPIIIAKNEEIGTTSAVEIWERRRYMSGVKGAPCTMLLKKEARYQFELKHDIAFHVLGFTVEEKDRHDIFTKYERENLLPVLIDAGLTKQDCFNVVTGAGIELPFTYKQGYPNANCKGCPKATSPTYWNHLRKTDPDIFKARAELSRRIGARLVRYKGKRIFLDELPDDAIGRKMKSYECGIFCDLPKNIKKNNH